MVKPFNSSGLRGAAKEAMKETKMARKALGIEEVTQPAEQSDRERAEKLGNAVRLSLDCSTKVPRAWGDIEFSLSIFVSTLKEAGYEIRHITEFAAIRREALLAAVKDEAVERAAKAAHEEARRGSESYPAWEDLRLQDKDLYRRVVNAAIRNLIDGGE